MDKIEHKHIGALLFLLASLEDLSKRPKKEWKASSRRLVRMQRDGLRFLLSREIDSQIIKHENRT